MGERKEKEKKKEKEKGDLPRERLTTSNARKDKYERRNMNENDLSDLVFKNKKEWGFQNEAAHVQNVHKSNRFEKNF